MELRHATLDELLQHCGEQLHVLAADPNDDWGWAEELQRAPEWQDESLTGC